MTDAIQKAIEKLESVGICINLDAVHEAIDEATESLRAIQKTHVLVPREPTDSMKAAGQGVVWKGGARSGPVQVSVTTGAFKEIYRAMINAYVPPTDTFKDMGIEGR